MNDITTQRINQLPHNYLHDLICCDKPYKHIVKLSNEINFNKQLPKLATVYALLCPVTNKPFYIGQTAHKLQKRLKEHIAFSKYLKTTKDIYIYNLPSIPIIKKLITVPFYKILKYESFFINYYLSKGYYLLNIKLPKNKTF